MLVRGAVLTVGKRNTLTWLALPRRCSAAKRVPIESDAVMRLLCHELERKNHVALDDPVDLHLLVQRKVSPDVVEQRPCGICKVAPVRGQPFHC